MQGIEYYRKRFVYQSKQKHPTAEEMSLLYLFEIVAEQDRDIVQCRKLLAERSIEHGSQSEDKQADCLSKNAT